jgi:HEAT repeat protein
VAAAIGALGEVEDPEAEDLLERAARTGGATLRGAALDALGRLGTARASAILASAANLPDPPNVAAMAINALRRVASNAKAGGQRAAIDTLLTLGSGHPKRDEIVATLGSLPPSAVASLAQVFASGDVQARLTAVEALARMRKPEASEALAQALGDPHPAVRGAAVAAFGRLGTRGVARTVVALQTGDPDPGVRRRAILVCQRHGWSDQTEGPGRE